MSAARAPTRRRPRNRDTALLTAAVTLYRLGPQGNYALLGAHLRLGRALMRYMPWLHPDATLAHQECIICHTVVRQQRIVDRGKGFVWTPGYVDDAGNFQPLCEECQRAGGFDVPVRLGERRGLLIPGSRPCPTCEETLDGLLIVRVTLNADEWECAICTTLMPPGRARRGETEFIPILGLTMEEAGELAAYGRAHPKLFIDPKEVAVADRL